MRCRHHVAAAVIHQQVELLQAAIAVSAHRDTDGGEGGEAGANRRCHHFGGQRRCRHPWRFRYGHENQCRRHRRCHRTGFGQVNQDRIALRARRGPIAFSDAQIVVAHNQVGNEQAGAHSIVIVVACQQGHAIGGIEFDHGVERRPVDQAFDEIGTSKGGREAEPVGITIAVKGQCLAGDADGERHGSRTALIRLGAIGINRAGDGCRSRHRRGQRPGRGQSNPLAGRHGRQLIVDLRHRRRAGRGAHRRGDQQIIEIGTGGGAVDAIDMQVVALTLSEGDVVIGCVIFANQRHSHAI